MIEELIIFVGTNLLSILITMHINAIRNKKLYRNSVFNNFDKINKHIKIIVSALCKSNGFGERFEAEYNDELKTQKLKDDLDADVI